ncbi:MAG: hypothetical protein JW741_21775 [Sedimentisphaerales bacterium]|nr:hypothetical protein [Sedimentisphaerales bacterium]
MARDPRFISGIYNYCDRWCERCAFTSRCMNYAMSEEEFDSPESRDMENQAFWDKLHGLFAVAQEMLEEKAQELDIDFDEADFEEYAERDEQVRKTAQAQPYCRAAMGYMDRVDAWFEANKDNLEVKSDELESLAQADIPGTNPVNEAAGISDCLEVVRWYQRHIWVKLCRAASGTVRAEVDDLEYALDDADGSAKVAIIGIERSTAAWAALLSHLPDQEQSILTLLASLRVLLRLVESAFPNARAFLRPGFDTEEGLTAR